MDAAGEVLAAADDRDAKADARDNAAIGRENALDLEDFLGREEGYGERWPERLAADLDREHSRRTAPQPLKIA